MKKRKNLVFLASCLAVSAVAAGVAKLDFNGVNAESPIAFTGEQTLYVDASGELYTTETANATKVDFKMEMAYGAAVRMVVGEGNGLRFKTYVNANAYDALSSAIEAGNFSMGALIGPSYLVGEQLTFADDEETYQDVVQTEKGWSSQMTSGNYTYYSAIYDVPTAALNMNFTAQSYAKFTLSNGETLFVYAKNAEKQEGDAQNANVRSVKYIADKALADSTANLSGTQEEILTELQAMKEDGVTFNATVTGANEAQADKDGAWGSVYSAAFTGENVLSLNGGNYNEFKIKFSEAVALEDLQPAGKVTLMEKNAFVSEAVANEWVTVIVEGNTFSVNKAVSATIYDVKECTGYWLARNEKYLLNLVGGIDASKLTVGSSNEHFSAESPAPIEKPATYQGAQNVTFTNYQNSYAKEEYNTHIFNWNTTNADWWSMMSPQVHLTGAVKKAELQAMLEAGYQTVSFKVTVARDVEGEGETGEVFRIINLDAIKTLLDSGVSLEEARTTISGNLKAYMSDVVWMYRSSWKTCSFSVEDLVACYDVLDLVPLYFNVFQGNQTAPTFYNVYVTDFTFTREVAAPTIKIDGVAVEDTVLFMQVGALSATVNEPYELKLNGQKFVSGATLTEGTYTLTASSSYSDHQAVSVKLVVAEDLNNLNNLNGFVDMFELTVGTSDNQVYYHAPGYIKKYATYQGEQEITFKKPEREEYGESKTAHVWSYSGTYAHYAGPQMHIASAITKAELQALLESGYTTMAFSFAVSKSVDDNTADTTFYTLDLGKVKAMISSSENKEAARATVEKSLKEYENTAHNDYMTSSWGYRCEWKTITLNVADLIACYEVLDLLPIFYDGLTESEYNVYITDFTFVKE